MSKHESLVGDTASAYYVSLLLEHSKLDAANQWERVKHGAAGSLSWRA